MDVVTIYTSKLSGLNYAKYKGFYYILSPMTPEKDGARNVVQWVYAGFSLPQSALTEGFKYTGRRYQF